MLHSSLHRPLVHEVLAAQCPLCRVVAHRQGRTQQRRETDPALTEQRRLEIHEGLLPRHGKRRQALWLLGIWGTNL